MKKLDVEQLDDKPERSRRLYKLDSLIEQELGKIFIKELEPPLGVLLSISNVSVTADLHEAQVKISILPFAERQGVFTWLERQVGMIQYHLNKKLRIYHVPKIKFVLDETEERASTLESLLDSLKK